jgi:hypothetical protein
MAHRRGKLGGVQGPDGLTGFPASAEGVKLGPRRRIAIPLVGLNFPSRHASDWGRSMPALAGAG